MEAINFEKLERNLMEIDGRIELNHLNIGEYIYTISFDHENVLERRYEQKNGELIFIDEKKISERHRSYENLVRRLVRGGLTSS